MKHDYKHCETETTFYLRNVLRSEGALANQHEVPCRSERRFFDCLSEARTSLEKSVNDLLMERVFAAQMIFLLLFGALAKK